MFNEITQTAVSGGSTTSFTYPDADSTSRATAGSTSYTNGILGVTGQTTSGSSTINYVREPSGPPIALHTGGASYYYVTDAIGSTIALTDSNLAVVANYHYSPWGATTSATGTLAATNPWRYATGYYDSQTGYTKMGARYYNPTTGRFTQPDPNSTWGGYTYASNNPISNSDPTGRLSFSIGGSVCAFGGCLKASVGVDDDGDVQVGGGAGVGVGASLDASVDPDGDYTSGQAGASESVSCNVGPFDYSVSTSDGESVSGNATVGTSEGVGCTASVAGSYTF